MYLQFQNSALEMCEITTKFTDQTKLFALLKRRRNIVHKLTIRT